MVRSTESVSSSASVWNALANASSSDAPTRSRGVSSSSSLRRGCSLSSCCSYSVMTGNMVHQTVHCQAHNTVLTMLHVVAHDLMHVQPLVWRKWSRYSCARHQHGCTWAHIGAVREKGGHRSEEHTSELQSR